MENIFAQLDAIEEENIGLPQLAFSWSQFSIPRLAEKPQNPIIETLRLGRNNSKHNGEPIIERDELLVNDREEDTQTSCGSGILSPVTAIWEQVLERRDPDLVCGIRGLLYPIRLLIVTQG